MAIEVISCAAEKFVGVVDLLKWIDKEILAENVPTDKKGAFAWVQSNLDQLRQIPQTSIRTWQKSGIVYASTADIKAWLDIHMNMTPCEAEAIKAVRSAISMAENTAYETIADETSGNAPFQMFMDFMDSGLTKLCCRWQLMVDSTVDGKNLFLAYLPGRIRIPIKNKKDIRGAIKTAVAMIAADQSAPHYFAAKLAMEMDARSEVASRKKAGHTLDEAAFDRNGGPFGFDMNLDNAI